MSESQQREVEVLHPGAHQATDKELLHALDAALEIDGFKRHGRPNILGYTNVAGQGTTFELAFDVEALPKPKA